MQQGFRSNLPPHPLGTTRRHAEVALLNDEKMQFLNSSAMAREIPAALSAKQQGFLFQAFRKPFTREKKACEHHRSLPHPVPTSPLTLRKRGTRPWQERDEEARPGGVGR